MNTYRDLILDDRVPNLGCYILYVLGTLELRMVNAMYKL
jgi:hypothetical protein